MHRGVVLRPPHRDQATQKHNSEAMMWQELPSVDQLSHLLANPLGGAASRLLGGSARLLCGTADAASP